MSKFVNMRQELLNYLTGEGTPIRVQRTLDMTLREKLQSGGLEKRELGYLRYNYMFLRRIAKNQRASAIFHFLLKHDAVYMAQLARKMGLPTRSVSHWVQSFEKQGLVKRMGRGSSFGSEVFFFLRQSDFPNVIELIKEAVYSRFGPVMLDELCNVNRDIQRQRIDKARR